MKIAPHRTIIQNTKTVFVCLQQQHVTMSRNPAQPDKSQSENNFHNLQSIQTTTDSQHYLEFWQIKLLAKKNAGCKKIISNVPGRLNSRQFVKKKSIFNFTVMFFPLCDKSIVSKTRWKIIISTRQILEKKTPATGLYYTQQHIPIHFENNSDPTYSKLIS